MPRIIALIAVAALGAGVTATASAERAGGLAGTYVMRGQGFGPEDAAYEGTCTLKGDGPAYEVSCFNNSTRHTYVGRGLSNGDTLAITIGDLLRGDHGGVFVGEYLVIYVRGANGALEGTWIDSRGAGGSESLTPLD